MTATTPPLRKQYLDIKRRHRDAVLLFRIGDFYEAFDDDARLIARELDIVLTSKPMGRNVRVPLAGVPHHSLERHLATLISRGHRVAICEQISDAPVKGGPSGRGLIERDVVRVVTPGTVLEPGLLQSKVNNYIAAFATDGRRAGIAYADVTTGDFAATELDADAALAESQRIAPSELLVPASFREGDERLPGFITRIADESFEPTSAKSVVLRHFGARTLAPFGLARWPLAVSAAAAIISYLNETQSTAAGQLNRLTSYHTENFMMLDERTVRSLEVFESQPGTPSLLSTLDETRTAMGGRLLRRWLRQPLLDLAEITRRQEHVAWFKTQEKERAELFAALEIVHDLERLSARTRAGIAAPSEVLALGQSLEAIPRVRAVLQRDAKRFGADINALPACEAAAQLIRSAINDALPSRAAEGAGIIRDGFSEELDSLRALLRDGKTFLAEMEQRERARTGIKSLRVGYNKVFGYFIEITRPNLHLVPEGYTRKQTLAQGERFITLELKEHESLVLNAQERISELELSLFRRVCRDVGKSRPEILSAAASIAHLDVVASFAQSAARWNYVRPVVSDDAALRVVAGRHAVLERTADGGDFVANDITLGGEGAPEIALITGPNMSGKSTYLRQTALLVLLAQAGSFVPAGAATIGLTDRIYTRIGLYDSIGSGESTFMTEMVETAHILHHATPRSLVLLDELGRGTSTYDGLAVARAVLEYIHNHPQLRSKTLFATHYHELTELAAVLPRVQNLHVEIAERGSELVFLYKISPGNAEKSYGVYAAKLAGLPRPVVRRAEELLREYEGQSGVSFEEIEAELKPGGQLNPSASTREGRIVQELLGIDPDALSPVEALMKLFELRKMAGGEGAGKNLKALKTA
ncbi:MAG TPA: DNA mismatch repair protein MutS [Pyrinomonadaceae bacterium]|jgi:DNA mismatch repair protein MutS|nr:DNA mismatch repair protein MutS [Pyrinomonadaceae bacterium]